MIFHPCIRALTEARTVRPGFPKHEKHAARRPGVGIHHGIGHIEYCDAAAPNRLYIAARAKTALGGFQIEIERVVPSRFGIQIFYDLAELRGILPPFQTLSGPCLLTSG